jgi:hypothetical protein
MEAVKGGEMLWRDRVTLGFDMKGTSSFLLCAYVLDRQIAYLRHKPHC